ncbi:MAG: DUF3987 domain-containing protein [Bacteroidetes bacterium]|nr:DUF3987 domain-containing protein [Bacteroidota bacterium]
MIEAFKREIQKVMTPPLEIIPEKIMRFSDDGGNNKDGWCILFVNGSTAGGAFGNWKGINKKWLSGNISQTRKTELNNQIKLKIQEDKEERDQSHAKAAKKAQDIWNQAKTPENHPYLKNKDIPSYGLRQSGKALLVPVMNGEKIVSLQSIVPGGFKKFMEGGKAGGGYFIIGENPKFMCEGYATGATIHKATGLGVVVAFNAGNLKKVSSEFNNIIICADNDVKKEKNWGVEAARATGLEYIVCPVDSDFNDLQQKQGLEAVGKALCIECGSCGHMKAPGVNICPACKYPETEENPLPLEREIEKPEPYPMDALGEIIGGAAQVMNRIIQAPDGLCAHSVLGFATHAVQSHADIIIDGRVISINEFFLSIGSRSARKSECDNKAGHIHRERQQELMEQYRDNMEKFRDEMGAYKEAKKHITGTKNELSDKNEDLAKLRKQKPEHPLSPIMTFSDPTTEGIHSLFENGTSSKYLCADEGGQVSGGYSMSKEKKTYTATTYSKYWDSAPIDRVRGGDGLSVLYDKRLSMHLMMQDKIASEFFNDDIMRNQGLLSRFLCTYPTPLTGSRHYKEENVLNTPEMKRFHKRISTILDHPGKLRTIPLDDDAKNLWIQTYEDIEKQSNKNLRTIEGFAGKAATHIIRLAGIFALFDDVNRNSVSIEYIQQAGILMEYYLNERTRLMGMAEVNKELDNAQQLINWIKERKVGIITLPDVYQYGPNRFRNKQQAQNTINVLEDHNHLLRLDGARLSEISGKKSCSTWRVA